MFKRYLACIFMVIAPSILLAAKGIVIHEKGNYCVVDTGCWCSVVEWYGGSIPFEGDKLVGDLDSYGFKDLYNISRRQETRVYVEDYLLDEDDAIEMVYELGG